MRRHDERLPGTRTAWAKVSIGATCAILLVAGSAVAGSPIKIVDRKRVAEFSPSVTDGWEVWTANTLAHLNQDHGYVRPTGGSTSKIPVKGSVRTGGIVTSGPYAGQVVLRSEVRGDDNIRFYNLTTKDVSKPPAGVNTSKDEFAPSVSGDYLAFIRGLKARHLILYQFSTGQSITLRSGGVTRVQVNGDYVGYSYCKTSKYVSCKVVARYQISTATTTRMPAPDRGRANYDPAVAADGTMYWVEGAVSKCGRHTKIRERSGGTTTTLWKAPAGVEVGFMELDVLGGNPTLAYSKAICPYNDDRWGAYRIDV